MNGTTGRTGPAVALLELASVAAGFESTDALSKESDVELLLARPVSPGKYIVLFTGAVDEVGASLRRGLETAGETLLDRLFIPNLEPTLLELLRGEFAATTNLDAVGIIETLSVASTLRAADLASKTASLRLVNLGLASGLGGRGWVAFTGEIGDVEAGVQRGAADAEAAGMLARRVIIPRPHAHMAEVLGAWAGGGQGPAHGPGRLLDEPETGSASKVRRR